MTGCGFPSSGPVGPRGVPAGAALVHSVGPGPALSRAGACPAYGRRGRPGPPLASPGPAPLGSRRPPPAGPCPGLGAVVQATAPATGRPPGPAPTCAATPHHASVVGGRRQVLRPLAPGPRPLAPGFWPLAPGFWPLAPGPWPLGSLWSLGSCSQCLGAMATQCLGGKAVLSPPRPPHAI